jgi:hypothetical protein
MDERPIPEAALRDKSSVEMLRVWIAERKLHCSIKVGMYREMSGIGEERAWGVILADVTRHLAIALEPEYSADRGECVRKIRENYLEELDAPTSDAQGAFVNWKKA